jgi:hypothetical protein
MVNQQGNLLNVLEYIAYITVILIIDNQLKSKNLLVARDSFGGKKYPSNFFGKIESCYT